MVFATIGFLVQMALAVVLIVPCLRRAFPNWSILRTSMISALPLPALTLAAPFLYDAHGMTMSAAMVVSAIALMTYAANATMVVAILRAWKPL